MLPEASTETPEVNVAPQPQSPSTDMRTKVDVILNIIDVLHRDMHGND